MALLMNNLWATSHFGLCSEIKKQSRTQVRCSVRDPTVLRSDSVEGNGFTSAVEDNKDKGSSLSDFGNGHMSLRSEKEKKIKEKFLQEQQLEPLWDDGYGNQSVKDYFELAKEIIKPDGGPPRWFSPASCGPPLGNSPLLLFLPGMDGLGLGLILHHKALGRVFELWCLHIPVNDRTPFEGLVQSVEETVRIQHALFPNRPIYLVGDSFGGCLALSVAARNPNIDLVLILSNPATSFSRSQLQPLLPLLESFPNELHIIVPYFLSLVMGEPMKMASVTIDSSLPPRMYVEQLTDKVTGLLPLLPGMADIIPKEALLWKLKLLKSAASYANSRLHAVTAEVLVLASGKDNVLPSRDEARRLVKSMKNCKMKYFKDNGHTILFEDGVNLLTIMKATHKYRYSRRYDPVLDYLPPSSSEFKQAFENSRWYRYLTGPVMFSTLEDGTMVRGLSGVPIEGPVLLVGYHNLMGLEVYPLVEEFLRATGILLRGVAHPSIFFDMVDGEEFTYIDTLKLFGATPVAGSNLFKLLARKSHVLLYPGGAREALHRKGEAYKVVWPEQPEFVRMAARFGATIVPFGAIGEDDVVELVLDYDDQMKIPILNDYLKKSNELEGVNVRAGAIGEIANQALYIPGFVPKVPGRLYYYFGKPIPTKGRQDILKDKQKAREMYLQIKSDVENNISYLLNKREKDPYRSIFERTAYRAFSAPIDQVPTFNHSS